MLVDPIYVLVFLPFGASRFWVWFKFGQRMSAIAAGSLSWLLSPLFLLVRYATLKVYFVSIQLYYVFMKLLHKVTYLLLSRSAAI